MTISIISMLSGSTRRLSPASKSPARSQVHAVVTCERSSAFSPSIAKKPVSAATNATDVESVAR